MKVAIVDVLDTWKYDLGLAKELSQLGVDVTLITSKSFPVVDESVFAGSILREFPNVRAYSSSLMKGIHYILGAGKALRRLKAGNFDVIHWQLFNVFPPIEYCLARLFLRLQKRLIVTVHDVKPWSAVKGSPLALLRATYKTAARLIVHHELNQDELVETFNLPHKRICVVPHGAHTHIMGNALDPGQSRKTLGLPEKGQIILFFGEIRPEKGLRYLVLAMKAVLKCIPDVHLVIAGRPRHTNMAHYVPELDDPDLRHVVITHLERIPDELVESYFAAASVVVLPYLAITQSGVLLEAMTTGRPVVVTDVGAIGATVRDADAGQVVPPAQIQPLADAIVHILENPEQAQKMAHNGRRAALDTYSWSRCAQQTLAVYQDSLKNSC